LSVDRARALRGGGGPRPPHSRARGGGAPTQPPPIPTKTREEPEGVSGGLRLLPMPQDAPPVTPRRDPLEGLIGGLLLAQDAPQVMHVDQQDPAAPQPEQQGSATAMAQEPPARPSHVCARHGQRRIYYAQNNHRYWRCAYRR